MKDRMVQDEMYGRTSDRLPFIDQTAVKCAIKAVLDKFPRITRAQGEILFPLNLSPREQAVVRERLARHHYSLRSRVIFVAGVPLQEGCGTLICIESTERR